MELLLILACLLLAVIAVIGWCILRLYSQISEAERRMATMRPECPHCEEPLRPIPNDKATLYCDICGGIQDGS